MATTIITKSNVFPYYNKMCREMASAYEVLKDSFNTDYVTDLCALRGYAGEEQKNLIREMKIGTCVVDDTTILGEHRKELGLVSRRDNFLLDDIYIIPVHDMRNNIVALIGYYPDIKKYITTSSPFFAKECMFFNFRQAYDLAWKEFGGNVFVVEGIFDCLSLRAIGLPAMATMGATVSDMKCTLLGLFNKVIAIPDDDDVGRRATNRYSKYGWKVPYNATFLRFHGGTFTVNDIELKCKDMDNFVSWYEADDVRSILTSFFDSHEEIEDLYI